MKMLDRKVISSCRTCMKTDVNLINLYEPVMRIDESNTLVELLMECTAIQVKQNDGLPQYICEDCTKILKTFSTFRQQANNANLHFKTLLIEQNTKIEIKVEDEVEVKYENKVENDFEYFESFSESPIEFTDTNKCTIKPENEIFNCTQCSKSFHKGTKYYKHLQSHTKHSYPCPYCDKQFRKESSWRKHLTKHDQKSTSETLVDKDFELVRKYTTVAIKNENGTEEYRYQCRQCTKLFTKLGALSTHINKHELDKDGKQFTCDACGKGFHTKPLLKRHIKLHFDKPHKCTKCERRYSRIDQLRAHMNTHKDNKSNVCPHCNKAFAQVCSLKDHIRTHTRETPYLCSECGKGFANSSNLRQHMLRHTGVKPYECKLCPKSFCTKGQMTSHMATHTGAHPYKCDKCGAAFTKPNSLKKHSLIHTGLRPFGCDTCPMRFTCKDHLKRHNRIHTGEKPYKCKFCVRAFTQSNDLVKHMRTHLGQNIYDCSVCGLGFRLQSELKQHYPVHFSSDEPAVQTLIEQTKNNFLEQAQSKDTETIAPQEKFMITINSVEGSNMVAINIEPESSMLKV